MQILIRFHLISGLLSICATVLGSPIDEAIVARFEAAGTSKEQQQIALEIHERLDDGPIAEHLIDRVITVLTSRSSLGNSRYMVILEKIAAPEDLSETSINSVARGLITDGIAHDWPALQTLRGVLTAYQQAHGLPEAAYSMLKQSLHSHRPYWMVIEVLSTITANDPRYGDALSAIVDALSEHEHYGIRSAAIAGINQMSKDRPLSEHTLDVLQNAALSDEYVSVRIEAMELLAQQDLNESRKQIIGESLSRVLIMPTPGVWQRAPSDFSLADRYLRAVDLLTRLYEPPYPAHVINAFIMQTKSFAAYRCIELLKANPPPGGFSNAQREQLENIAAQHYDDAVRAAIFKLVAPQLDADSLRVTLDTFENGVGSTARITAGFALMNHYDRGAVPGSVIDVAERVMRETTNQKLQRVAALLIARGDEAFSRREQRLLASLESNRFYSNLYPAFVELYGEAGFEDLVVRFAADTSVPVWLRAGAILDLGQHATPGTKLSSETEAALLKAAKISSEYPLISAIHNALTAWHIRVPMIVYLKEKNTHSMALFVLLVLCTLINLIVCLFVLVKLLVAPPRKGARIASRTLIISGWLVLSFGMLVLLAFGLLGFYGHNYLPNPRDTLLFQIPMYIGMLIYVIIARFIFVSAKSRQARA